MYQRTPSEAPPPNLKYTLLLLVGEGNALGDAVYQGPRIKNGNEASLEIFISSSEHGPNGQAVHEASDVPDVRRDPGSNRHKSAITRRTGPYCMSNSE